MIARGCLPPAGKHAASGACRPCFFPSPPARVVVLELGVVNEAGRAARPRKSVRDCIGAAPRPASASSIDLGRIASRCEHLPRLRQPTGHSARVLVQYGGGSWVGFSNWVLAFRRTYDWPSSRLLRGRVPGHFDLNGVRFDARPGLLPTT